MRASSFSHDFAFPQAGGLEALKIGSPRPPVCALLRSMSAASPLPRKKLLLLLGAGLLLGVAALGALVLGVDVKAVLRWLVDRVSEAGPGVYFSALAFLPAVGLPTLTLVLPAGAIFGERLGMPTVVGLTLAAMTFNLLLTYVLARWLLRPFLARLVARLGYKMPEVATGDATDLLIILRVTPGVPFLVQNYLAGLSDVPFGRYVGISCLVVWSYNTGFVVFGDALLHGKAKIALVSFGLLVALAAGTHLVRRHLAGKNAAAASAADARGNQSHGS